MTRARPLLPLAAGFVAGLAAARVLPHHGKFHRRHEDFVRRVAPEEILVSAPLGYGSAKVLDALPSPPRLTGQEGAIQILLK